MTIHSVPRTVHELASSPVPPPQRDELQNFDLAAQALLRAFVVEQIEKTRTYTRKLGFAHLDYGRLFIRDKWTLFAIARELGCTVEDLLEPPQPAPESRVAWSEIAEASESLMAIARGLPPMMREVTLLRATGLGWRKIGKALPGRASFSLAQDYADGIALVWRRGERECRLLALNDHPKFIVVKTRSMC
jgi:hypothetical protein